jgi:hypothetical protein|tara:strand:- start:24 stop:149 length:126 start_codon:yes stop_codon:yes gene_type:complete
MIAGPKAVLFAPQSIDLTPYLPIPQKEDLEIAEKLQNHNLF